MHEGNRETAKIVKQLGEQFDELSDTLSGVISELQNGRVPTERLEEEVAALRRAFLTACDRLNIDANDATLTQLEAATTRLHQLHELDRTRGTALASLEGLEALVHLTGELDEELSRFQTDVTKWVVKVQCASTAAELNHLIETARPWVALRQLVLEGDQLTEQRVEELEHQIGSSVHRALTRAAYRGKLALHGGRGSKPGRCDSRLAAQDDPQSTTRAATHDRCQGSTDLVERAPDAKRYAARASSLRPADPVLLEDGATERLLERFPPKENPSDLLRRLTQDRSVEGSTRQSSSVKPREMEDTAVTDPKPAEVAPQDGAEPPSDGTQNDEHHNDEFVREANSMVGHATAHRSQVQGPEPDRTPTSDQTAVPAAAMAARVSGEIDSTAELAEDAPTDAEAVPKDSATAVEDEVWSYLAEGRGSLAYHLMLARERLSEDGILPSWLLKALILADEVRLPLTGRLAPELAYVFGNHDLASLVTSDQVSTHHRIVLAIAATMRPALLAPNTGAISLLQDAREVVHKDYPELARVLAVIGKYSERGVAFDVRRLRTVGSNDDWHAEQAALRDEAQDWLERARQYTVSYAPANAVWHQWIAESGPLGAAVHAMARGREPSSSAIDQVIRDFANPNDFNRQLQEAFRSLAGKPARRKEILGPARRKLERNALEVLDLVDRWASLAEVRPDRPRSYEGEQIESLRKALRTTLPVAREAIAAARDGAPSIADGIALRHINECLAFIDNTVLQATPYSRVEPTADEVLNQELVLTNLALNATGAPRDDVSPIDITAAIRNVDPLPADWIGSLQHRLNRADTLGASIALDRIRVHEPQQYDALANDFSQKIAGMRLQIESRVVGVRARLEGALSLSLLRDREFAELAGRLDHVEGNLSVPPNHYEDHLAVLDNIEDQLREKRASRRTELIQLLETLDVEDTHPVHGRVLRALEDSDFVSASEYLYAHIEGREITTSSDRRDPFREFFLDRYEAISDVLEQTKARPMQLVDRVKRQNLPPAAVSMQDVPKPQAKQASEMLEGWFSMKRDKQASSLTQRLRSVLDRLGFDVEKIEPWRRSANSTGYWYRVSTAPIADRNRCPIPQFGSAANGRYKVACFWGREGEEDIVNAVSEAHQENPVMVFHFGRLTDRRRKNIAQLVRERRPSSFIVVDDAAVLFLCGERGARMPVMYDILLPFAFAEPYTTTAGLVPPEMFYGRDDERRSLRDPYGSSFVYGGRQLGKTALLRAVEREAHQPAHGSIAVWKDLKGENIGISRSPEDLLHVVTGILRDQEVIPKDAGKHTWDRLRDWIIDYLAGDPSRRILLLLDEADMFLEADATEQFAVTSRLKSIMDASDRRFKVVLAGLHNVQRMTRQANQPLAHYGDPILVGPLLNSGEAHAARELIRRPFAALGYRFESEDLITRILAQTNYYPNLIQLYGSHLLRHLRSVSFNPTTTPPYVITSEHLHAVYQSHDLKRAIRDRFHLTLQLDQRYEVIAYTLAYLCKLEPEGLARGFSVGRIRDEAIDKWPEGFAGSDPDHVFSVILDEMIGLGILRSPSAQQYTLRNGNVLDIMGTDDEIETQLLLDRELPVGYDPLSFRTPIPDGQGQWLAAITASQESELLPQEYGYSLVFGTQASGLFDLARSLKGLERSVISVNDAHDVRAFERRLSGIDLRRRVRMTVILVEAVCPWTEEWIAVAAKKLEALKAKDRWVRIVFAGGPEAVRGLLHSDSQIELRRRIARSPLVSLGPWHDAALRTWLSANHFATLAPDERADIHRVTGNWPGLLRRLEQPGLAIAGAWKEALGELEAQLEDPSVAAEVLAEFGLDQPEPMNMLAVMHALDAVSSTDLFTLGDIRLPLARIQLELKVAERLQLVRPSGKGKYNVDAVVGSLASVATS